MLCIFYTINSTSLNSKIFISTFTIKIKHLFCFCTKKNVFYSRRKTKIVYLRFEFKKKNTLDLKYYYLVFICLHCLFFLIFPISHYFVMFTLNKITYSTKLNQIKGNLKIALIFLSSNLRKHHPRCCLMAFHSRLARIINHTCQNHTCLHPSSLHSSSNSATNYAHAKHALSFTYVHHWKGERESNNTINQGLCHHFTVGR